MCFVILTQKWRVILRPSFVSKSVRPPHAACGRFLCCVLIYFFYSSKMKNRILLSCLDIVSHGPPFGGYSASRRQRVARGGPIATVGGPWYMVCYRRPWDHSPLRDPSPRTPRLYGVTRPPEDIDLWGCLSKKV